MHLSNYLLAIEKKSGTERWIRIQIPSEKQKLEFYQRNGIAFYLEKNCALENYLHLLFNITQSRLDGERKGGNIWKYVSDTEGDAKNESM